MFYKLNLMLALALLPLAARVYAETADLSKRVFPIGLYDVPKNKLAEVKAAGFNTLLNAYTNIEGYSDEARSQGLRMIPYVHNANVEDLKDSDHLSAWYLQDEPDENKIAPDRVQRDLKNLQNRDRSKPVFLTVYSPEHYEKFARYSDIFAIDPYAVKFKDAHKNDLTMVAKQLDQARSIPGPKEVWVVLQAFHALPWWQRPPTPEEIRVMTYLAINHGAKGIAYFAYDSDNAAKKTLPQNEQLFTAIKKLNAEVTAIGTDLLAIKGRPTPVPVPRGSRVDAAIVRLKNSERLIVVNPDPAPTTIQLQGRTLHLGGFQVLQLDTPKREDIKVAAAEIMDKINGGSNWTLKNNPIYCIDPR